jgi:hypothetical protein
VAIQLVVGSKFPRILSTILLTDFNRSSLDYACLRDVWPQKMGYLAIHHYCFNWCWGRMCECVHVALYLPNNLVNYQWGIISNEPTAVSPFARAARGCSEPLGKEQWVTSRIPEGSQSYLLHQRHPWVIRCVPAATLPYIPGLSRPGYCVERPTSLRCHLFPSHLTEILFYWSNGSEDANRYSASGW